MAVLHPPNFVLCLWWRSPADAHSTGKVKAVTTVSHFLKRIQISS